MISSNKIAVTFLLLFAIISRHVKIDAFTPIIKQSTTRTNNKIKIEDPKIHHRQTTKLNWGVIVPVPDDFFTVGGITLGLAYTITRSWNRVVVENVAWEKRLEEERMRKLEEEMEGVNSSNSMIGTYTELDLRKMDAEVAPSSYGPDAMQRRRENGMRRRSRTITLDDDEDYDDDDFDEYETNQRSTNRSYSMTDEQINNFEEQYGVSYDPYYDEPYTVDELPDDISFIEDKVYGDRRYQNGEIFYRDENNKNLYWRQGGRPRLKQFWELF